MIFIKKNISISVLVLLLSACASPQIANIKYMDNAVLEQAEKTTQNPRQICEAASMAIARANKEEFNFFAPLHLEQASDDLKKGQDEIKTEKTVTKGMESCFKVNKLVENGMIIKSKVKSSLSDALAELDMLKKVDEEKKFTSDIQDYVDDVIDLVKKIEEGNMNEAMQGQAELLKGMQKLEVNIVLDKNLAPVEAMIERARDEDADQIAKKTFKKAETELESAKKFIRIYYRNNEQVNNVSATAMRKAKHAYYVAKEVETLTELKPEAAEEKVLYIESLLERINRRFNKGVVIGHSLYEQASIIAKRLDAELDAQASISRDLALIKQQYKNNLDTEKPLPEKPVGPDEQAQTPVEKTNAAQPVADEPKPALVDETSTTQPVADELKPAPVDETSTAQPVADEPKPAPVDETSTAQPVADEPKPTPVDETSTAQPVADEPKPTPVDETNAAQPVADELKPAPVDESNAAQSLSNEPKPTSVDETSTTQPIANKPKPAPVDETSATQPVADEPKPAPVDESNAAQPIANEPKQTPAEVSKPANL